MNMPVEVSPACVTGVARCPPNWSSSTEPIVELRVRVAGGRAAVRIDKDDAVVAVVRPSPCAMVQPLTVLLVMETPLASPAKTMHAAGAAGFGAAVADVGDGVVVDRGVRAAEVAVANGAEQRPDLDAVLGGVRGVGADDGVVVDVGRQRRAVDEDAGLLEAADGRVLDLDGVAGVGAAMRRIVPGNEDAVIALNA